jgi:hypothetical protein
LSRRGERILPSVRTFAILCAGSFLALLAIGWGGSILQASGIIHDAGAFKIPILATMLGLTALFAVSAVPVMVGLVLGFQRNIGNENVPVIRSALKRQNLIVFVIWGLMAAGAAVAIPAAILSGGFDTINPTPPSATPLGPSEGTLVARPGMSFAEMARQSSLKVDIAARAPLTSAVGSGGLFDFHIPGTGLYFKNCRYYFASPYTRDPSRIESLSIGTSPHTVSRAELEAANTELRARLAADGWLTGHEVYRSAEDRSLHGGALRGPEGRVWAKGDIVLDIETRRMDDPMPGENLETAGKWIQFIGLWRREDYAGIERYAFAKPEK